MNTTQHHQLTFFELMATDMGGLAAGSCGVPPSSKSPTPHDDWSFYRLARRSSELARKFLHVIVMRPAFERLSFF
jgi:hypothetical protein